MTNMSNTRCGPLRPASWPPSAYASTTSSDVRTACACSMPNRKYGASTTSGIHELSE